MGNMLCQFKSKAAKSNSSEEQQQSQGNAQKVIQLTGKIDSILTQLQNAKGQSVSVQVEYSGSLSDEVCNQLWAILPTVNLIELDIELLELSSGQSLTFLASLNENTTLNKLSLSTEHMTEIVFIKLWAFVTTNQSIESLKLYAPSMKKRQITEDELSSMGSALQANSKLQKLSIIGHNVGTKVSHSEGSPNGEPHKDPVIKILIQGDQRLIQSGLYVGGNKIEEYELTATGYRFKQNGNATRLVN